MPRFRHCQHQRRRSFSNLLSGDLGGRRVAQGFRTFSRIDWSTIFLGRFMLHAGASAFPFEPLRWLGAMNEFALRERDEELPVRLCPPSGRPNVSGAMSLPEGYRAECIRKCYGLEAMESQRSRFAWRDRILGHEGNAVHKVWQNESVPMNGRWHLKLVQDFHVKFRRPYPENIPASIGMLR